MSFPISVKGVLLEAGRVVLLENERDEWELPGGHLEAGEDPATCLFREFAEELGIKVAAKTILDSWVYEVEVLPAQHVVIVTYGVERFDQAAPRLGHEHRRFGTFSPDELDRLPMPEGYRRSIRSWLAMAGSVEPAWLSLARELQTMSQTGLFYSKDKYDTERYARLRVLATTMMAMGSGVTTEKIIDLFSQDTGYATPRVDVRGAAFRDGRVLMVRERSDGRWALPGGWADVNQTAGECVIREIEEESGFNARAVKLCTVWDRRRHGHVPPHPFYVYKMFSCARSPEASRARASKPARSRSSAKTNYPIYPLVGSPRPRSGACSSITGDPSCQPISIEFQNRSVRHNLHAEGRRTAR